jgi:hypothetical protein
MIADVLLFPTFLCFIYAFGTGVLRMAHGRAGMAGYPSWAYFTVALFTLGFLAVVFNFFTGVASPLFYVVVLAIAANGLRFLDIKAMYGFLALGMFLAPFAGHMPWGPDAGSYHLPYQMWLRDEKIVFGIANFNTRFGFSSFSEYIQAPLWIHGQFKLLSYMQATYFLILMLFLFELAQSSNVRAAAAGVLTLAALIINNKYFVIGYTSTDTPCGVFFAIAFLYGFMLASENAVIGQRRLTLFFLCALFTFFSKASGAIIALWALFVVAYLIRKQHLSFPALVRASILPAGLMFVWMLHGVIISGCLLYPVASTCFDVPWTAAKSAIDNSNAITAWARQEGAGGQVLHDWSWLGWWWNKWSWFCLYEVATVVVAAGLYRFCCKEKLEMRRDITIPALLFTLLSLAVWFIKSPAVRFGIGIFTILPAVVTMSIDGFRQLPQFRIRKSGKLCDWIGSKTVLSTLGGILIIMLSVELVIVDAVGWHKRAENAGKSYFDFTMLTVPTEPTRPNPGFGLMPMPGSGGCWLTQYCSPDYNINDTIREKYGYKYFHE